MNRNTTPNAASGRATGAVALGALVCALALPALAAFDGEAVPPELEAAYTQAGYTPPALLPPQEAAQQRQDVQAAFFQAQRQGTLAGSGELGDTETVLAARDRVNAEQTEWMVTQVLDALLTERQAQAEAELLMAEAMWGDVPLHLYELQLVQIDYAGRTRLAMVDPTGWSTPSWVGAPEGL